MKVELFYFDGCPNHVPARDRLRQILQQEGRPEHVEEINVTSPEQAQALGFLGSPTVKINGLDVETEARSSQAYAMACRTYRNAGRQEGLPSVEMISAAVREASGQSAGGHDCCAQTVPAASVENRTSKSSALVMAGSIFAAILASFCCILPIVFGLTGLTVVGASAAFAAWRPYLLNLWVARGGLLLCLSPGQSRVRSGECLRHVHHQAIRSPCPLVDHVRRRGLRAVSVLLGAGRGISAPRQGGSRGFIRVRPSARFIQHQRNGLRGLRHGCRREVEERRRCASRKSFVRAKSG
jgi:hypothetical protein